MNASQGSKQNLLSVTLVLSFVCCVFLILVLLVRPLVVPKAEARQVILPLSYALEVESLREIHEDLENGNVEQAKRKLRHHMALNDSLLESELEGEAPNEFDN